jgi:hypothetical protein
MAARVVGTKTCVKGWTGSRRSIAGSNVLGMVPRRGIEKRRGTTTTNNCLLPFL